MTEGLPDFTKLWNFNDPALSEQRFRELLPVAAQDESYHAELLTQIARTYSLRAKFSEAHETLDVVEQMLTPNLAKARVRYLLERGRTYNSSGRQIESLTLFSEAYHLAENIGEYSLTVDAVHMSAIAESDISKKIEWNLKGIEMSFAYPAAYLWRWALYNNIGECYLSAKEYDKALEFFKKLEEFEIERNGKASIYTMKDQAKALRLSGHPIRSREIVEPLLVNLVAENRDDGYIREELAESLFAIGKSEEAKLHFRKAFELLSSDDWYKTNGDLDRLKRLGG